MLPMRRDAMIRANLALTRQAQDFFRRHLVGIYRWDDVVFLPKERNDLPEIIVTARGRRRRTERAEGKFHAIVQMQFPGRDGIWQIRIEGPNEHPPLGWIELDGPDIIDGPLDSSTWDRIGEFIKKKHEELKYVA
jgi:hypothetical protein